MRSASFHSVLENIHPFMDGNGRTGRQLPNRNSDEGLSGSIDCFDICFVATMARRDRGGMGR
ncbi:Fic family protein [Bifidobacterium dentium]|nr:Fic family protein [Bifidobacterium dentium]MBF9708115.1 Fic family protein [Bifidobacterium dentium]